MAVTELAESQEWHETMYGISLRRVFKATWSDWDDGTFDIFIGDTWTTNSAELRVSDIIMTGIDNVNVKIEVLYSTQGKTRQEARPDQAASWDESLDVHTDQYIISDGEPYYKFNISGGGGSTGAWTSWTSTFQTGIGTDSYNTPDLTHYHPGMTYIVTTYSSTLYLARILPNVGKVNSTNFLKTYFSQLQDTGIISDTDNYNDIGLWFFSGCNIRRVRHDCWQYQFTMLYNSYQWNKWRNQFDVNQYDTFDFHGLWAGMDATDSPTHTTGGGH